MTTRTRAQHADAGSAQGTDATTRRDDVIARAADGVSDAAAVIAREAPSAVASSRDLVGDVIVALRGATTESLVVGTIFSTGLSFGMLLSRAPRSLVALAAVPAIAFGGTLLSRRPDRAQLASR